MAWSRITDKKVEFNNIGRDILYLVMCFTNGELIPVSFPFAIDSLGRKIDYIIDKNSGLDISLGFYNRFENGVIQTVMLGEEYNLFYWDGKWKEFGWQKCTGNEIAYKKIPKCTIYKIENNIIPNKLRFRPFIITESGGQIFW